MAFDAETLAQIKAAVKEALAEVGSNSVVVVPRTGVWDYGDALMSPPDALGRVKLKFVELDMVSEFGGHTIKYKELHPTLGLVDREAPIPTWFFMPENRHLTPTADVAVGSAQFYQNCAFPLRERTNWLGRKTIEPDTAAGPLADTFASQWTYEDLKARLIHVARRVRDDKGANMVWNIRSDELDIG